MDIVILGFTLPRLMLFRLMSSNFLFPSICVIIRFITPFLGTNCNVNRGFTVNFMFLVENILLCSMSNMKFDSLQFASSLNLHRLFLLTNCNGNRGITVNSYNFFMFLVANILLYSMSNMNHLRLFLEPIAT